MSATHEQMVLAAIKELGGSPTAREVVDHLCPPVTITREQAEKSIHTLLTSETLQADWDWRLSISKEAS